jgi:hypothetical protein
MNIRSRQLTGKRIVVGGPTRKAGKTTLVCALLEALPELHWIAVKITADDHGQPQPLWEETVANARKGTGRYLAAGARRSFLLTSTQESIDLDPLWAQIDSGANLIFESNRIVDTLSPDLTLALLGAGDEAKPSFAPFLERADAILGAKEASSRLPLRAAQRFFPATALEPLGPELLAWVRRSLYS